MASSAYRSVGSLSPLRRGLDLSSSDAAIAQLVASRSFRGETILFTSDGSMGGWAFHFVHQLRRVGYEHWFILADTDATCNELHRMWRPMEERYAEVPLSCAFSTFPADHRGWTRWSTSPVFKLWSTRWWVTHQLLRHGTSVLSLDVDAALFRDVYPLLHSPPLGEHDVVITRNADESESLNCGFVYFNLRARGGEGACVEPGCRRLPPPAAALNESGSSAACRAKKEAGAVAETRASTTRPAAEWMAQLLWERFLLFLETDKAMLRRPPGGQVLWEQDVWNDVVKSFELRRRVFPWAVGYGKRSDLWAKLGYHRRVSDPTIGRDMTPKQRDLERLEATHRSKRVGWRRSAAGLPPPWQKPTEERGRAFHEKCLTKPLLWLPLCPPLVNGSLAGAGPAADARARAAAEGGAAAATVAGATFLGAAAAMLGAGAAGGAGAATAAVQEVAAQAATDDAALEGEPLAVRPSKQAGAMAGGSLAVAPIWLASLGSDPESGWAGESPPPMAYLHLTNDWHCFPKPCWSKAGRLFWLRAHKLWDERLDTLGLTPQGPPVHAGARVLALPAATFTATLGALQPRWRTKGKKSRPPPRSEEKLAFRRLHALLHNLATAAALLGRRPLIPSVPCEFVRAVQPRRPDKDGEARFGLLLPSVVATGPADAPVCHLAPPQYRMYSGQQCWHSWITHDFDLPALLAVQPAPQPPNGTVRLAGSVAPRQLDDAKDEGTDAKPGGASGGGGGTRVQGGIRGAPIGGIGEPDEALEMWRLLCRDAERMRSLPLLFLEGLLPRDSSVPRPGSDDRFLPAQLRSFDTLLDSTVAPREFRKTLGGKPFWPSLLQPEQLLRLQTDCPSAANLSALRRACAGLFLTTASKQLQGKRRRMYAHS